MILEYEKIQKVYAHKDCEHVVNDIIVFDDLIETKYVPKNFSAETKYFYLRDKHTEWDSKQKNQLNKFLQAWFNELGYDSTKYFIDTNTAEIKELSQINETVIPDENITTELIALKNKKQIRERTAEELKEYDEALKKQEHSSLIPHPLIPITETEEI